MNIVKEDVFVNRKVLQTECNHLAECDTIVPDSQPDLLKVLQMDAKVRVKKREISNGKFIISGTVDFCVLYVPESAEGICSIEAKRDFEHIEACPQAKSSMFMTAKAEVEHLEFEPVNSRRLSLKAVVAMYVSVCEKVMISVPTEIEGEGIQTRESDFSALCKTAHTETEIVLDEQVVLPPGKASFGVILKNDVCISNKETKVIAGKLIAKGDVVVSTLYTPENEENITSIENTLPFTEILDVDGITEESFNNISFEISQCRIAKSANFDGDMRNLDCKIKMSVMISSDEKINRRAILDVYSTEGDIETKTEHYEINSLADSIETGTTVKESVSVPEGLPPIVQIYNIVAKPYVDEVVTDGKISVRGTIDTYILYITSKDDSPVYSFKTEIPFNVDVASEANLEGCMAEAAVCVNHVSYNLNAAGEIDLRISLEISGGAYKTAGVDIISEIGELSANSEPLPSIVLYFVQSGDTLWDVAKRYHTCAAYIEELNDIPEDGLKEGMQLLIPKA